MFVYKEFHVSKLANVFTLIDPRHTCIVGATVLRLLSICLLPLQQQGSQWAAKALILKIDLLETTAVWELLRNTRVKSIGLYLD